MSVLPDRVRRAAAGLAQVPVAVRATVAPGRMDELRRVLEHMGAGDRGTQSFGFAGLGGVHFARLVLLEESTEPGQAPVAASLILLSEIDGPREAHLDELGRHAGPALDATFGRCEGYPAAPTPAGRRTYLQERVVRPAAAYVNRPGRTVEQIHTEAVLRDRLEEYLDEHRDDLPPGPERARAAILGFVAADPDLRWALRPPPRPGLLHRLRQGTHLVVVGAALLLALPVLLLMLPAFVAVLRFKELTDPAPHVRPDSAHAARLAVLEDHGAQNQFSAIGYVKPGPFRLWTFRAVLWLIEVGARHLFVRGSLAGVKTIHFARWTPLDDYRRVIFTSNYDGSLEGYNDDFIDKVAFGLNASFSNGVGYPRTTLLLFRGARREQQFKDYLRFHQIPTQVFYSAYDRLSAVNIENNARIRAGLSGELDASEAAAWLRRL